MPKAMKIGFTGTQQGMTTRQRFELRDQLIAFQATEFHHGDCIGADAEAHEIAKALGLRIVIHPPESDAKRAFCEGYDEIRSPLPYLIRNLNIVNETSVLIATPAEASERTRSGTWSTVRRGRKAGKTVVVITPSRER